MGYNFYGWEVANVKAKNLEYKDIETPLDLYDALLNSYCDKFNDDLIILPSSIIKHQTLSKNI